MLTKQVGLQFVKTCVRMWWDHDGVGIYWFHFIIMCNTTTHVHIYYIYRTYVRTPSTDVPYAGCIYTRTPNSNVQREYGRLMSLEDGFNFVPEIRKGLCGLHFTSIG